VSKTLSELGRRAIADLGAASSAMPDNAADPLIEAVLSSKRICLYGAGSFRKHQLPGQRLHALGGKPG
jgi:hypothetical protein